MAEAKRKAKVAKEMAGCGISLRISETKWKGMGSRTLQGSEKVVNVGNEEVQQGGVAIMMSVGAKRALMDGCLSARGSFMHDCSLSQVLTR